MTDQITLATIVDTYGVPDPSLVGKLPKITCSACSKARGVCSEHTKVRCDQKSQPRRTDGWCGNWMTEKHIHIDFVGHADLTRILTAIDPTWEWAPLGREPDGSPMIKVVGDEASLWGSLTLLGTTRIGVGTCDKDKHDRDKELIGDLLRNCGMRFGIALSLWSKSEWQTPVEEPSAPASPPQDRIATTRSQAAATVDREAARQVLSDEEKAAAAALVDPETNPGNALVAKCGSQNKALKAARDYVKAHGDAEASSPTSFADLIDNHPALVIAMLEAD